jgi:hypothetical protein
MRIVAPGMLVLALALAALPATVRATTCRTTPIRSAPSTATRRAAPQIADF